MYQLIGSSTSPYVRRIRLWLAEQPFQFINLNIFSDEGRQALRAHTPAMKVPVLVDGDRHIYDSRVIFRYLCEQQKAEPLSWQQENLLTLVDSVNDSLVSLLLLDKSGLDTNQDMMFLRLQKERIANTMEILETSTKQGEFSEWDYPSIALYCLLDWASFRELVDLTQYPAMSELYKQHQSKQAVVGSDPRLA